MKFIADLHIHSPFSRATSKTLDPEHLALWAQKKGIRVIDRNFLFCGVSIGKLALCFKKKCVATYGVSGSGDRGIADEGLGVQKK